MPRLSEHNRFDTIGMLQAEEHVSGFLTMRPISYHISLLHTYFAKTTQFQTIDQTRYTRGDPGFLERGGGFICMGGGG